MFKCVPSTPLKLTTLMLCSALALSACEKPVPPPTAALNPPFDVASVRQSVQKPYTKSFACTPPPAPVKDLFFESIYGKKKKENSSIVSPQAYKDYKEATKPIKALESGLAQTANRYVRTNPPQPEIAHCVMSWIAHWAEADGFLGEANSVGEFVRKWVLSSISLAYIQVRDEPSIQPHLHETVREWIHDIAKIVVRDYSEGTHRSSRQNNHMYWAAWGVATASMAIDNREMFDWAMNHAKAGIEEIQDDGSLPLEMARGQKAYNYHHYAAIPLFLLAEAGMLNGVNLFTENDHGLRRLARLILENMDDQSYFVEKTGKVQNLDRTISPSNLSWMDIYHKYYKDPAAVYWLDQYRPMKQSRAGGDVTLLYTLQDVPKRKADKKKK